MLSAFVQLALNESICNVMRPERIRIRGRFCHRSVLVMNSSEVRALAPGSSPGPG